MTGTIGGTSDCCDSCTGVFLANERRYLRYTGKFDLTMNLPVVRRLCETCWRTSAGTPSDNEVAVHMQSVRVEPVGWCDRCKQRFGDSLWVARGTGSGWVHLCTTCFSDVRKDGLRLLPVLKARPKKRPAVKKRPARKVFDADLNLGITKYEGELDIVAVRSAYAFLRRGVTINIF